MRMLILLLTASLLASLATAPAAETLPPDSAYVTVDADGHFVLDGERQRYWAVIGRPYQGTGVKAEDDATVRAEKVANSRAGTSKLLDRFVEMGFNTVRLWDAARRVAGQVVVVPGAVGLGRPGDGDAIESVDGRLEQV
nr:hypothetical protein [Planctomycetota bacterium]